MFYDRTASNEKIVSCGQGRDVQQSASLKKALNVSRVSGLNFRVGILMLLSLLSVLQFGCSTSGRYVEQHEVKDLKIVFLDPESLHEEWTQRTGLQGTRFLPALRGGLPSIKSVKGFYDFTSDTLYCPKWNFEVCGHELHHAALGHFHSND